MIYLIRNAAIVFFLVVIVQIATCMAAHATLNDVDKQSFIGKNLLTNGGGENGKAGWSKTDADADAIFVVSTVEANTATFMHSGRANITWQPTDVADVLLMPSFTVTKGTANRNMVYSCSFRSDSSGAADAYAFEIYDSTNSTILNSVVVPSNVTSTQRYSLNFISGTNGTSYRGRLTTTGAPTTIGVDDCWLGPAETFNLSTSTVMTDWSSYTPTITGFGTVSLVSAQYRITGDTLWANGRFKAGTETAVQARISLPSGRTLNTGKLNGSYYDQLGTFWGVGTSTGVAFPTTSRGPFVIVADTTTTDSVSISQVVDTDDGGYFSPQTGTGVGGNATVMSFNFSVPISGSNTQTAYRPDQVSNSWSGYHDSTCSWTRANTSFGDPATDATCVLTEIYNRNFGTVSSNTSGGNTLPGIIFTPKRAGRYKVCADITAEINSAGSAARFRLIDEATTLLASGAWANASAYPTNVTLCGIVDASSTSSKTVTLQVNSAAGTVNVNNNAASGVAVIQWTIIGIDQSIPAPLLVNSVVNPRTGVSNIVSAALQYTGGVPGITRQDGSWISSLTDSGAGFITINLVAGTFSSAPNCTCSVFNETAANLRGCGITSTSTSTVVIGTQNYGGTAADYDSMIFCMGPK